MIPRKRTRPKHKPDDTVTGAPATTPPAESDTSQRQLPDDEDALARTAPAELNARRSVQALGLFGAASRIAGTPPTDSCSRVLQPLEVRQKYDAGLEFLEPGPLTRGAGEAVAALGEAEPYSRARHSMVDTLERPTTASVRASEQRLERLEKMGLLQSGVDAAQTMSARTSVEKMLCHQLAASHAAAMNLLGLLPGLACVGEPTQPIPLSEAARLGNTAARLMDAFASGVQALTRLKAGGTQRVVVQHQQLVVAHDGSGVVINAAKPREGRRPAGRRR